MLSDTVTQQAIVENVMYSRMMLATNPWMMSNDQPFPSNWTSAPELNTLISEDPADAGSASASASASGGSAETAATSSASAEEPAETEGATAEAAAANTGAGAQLTTSTVGVVGVAGVLAVLLL